MARFMRGAVRGVVWRTRRRLHPPHASYRPVRSMDVEKSVGPAGRLSIAAVIPLVHPAHANVQDYAVIERHLELTLASISRQTHGRVSAVIVGHRRPAWIDDVGMRAFFVDISKAESVRGQLSTPLDKGIKTTVGALVAQSIAAADVVLTVDADDLLAVDLAWEVEQHLSAHPNSNGVVWTRGRELTVAPGGEAADIRIDDAYLVNQFNRSCGTCRAITIRCLTEAMPNSFDALSHVATLLKEQVRRGPNAYTNIDRHAAVSLDRAVMDLGPAALTELEHLGRHVTSYFGLDPVGIAGAAKMCGHGQHDGSRGGGVHWARVLRRESPLNAIGACGLAGVEVGASHTNQPAHATPPNSNLRRST